jgi:hypothetical protein
MPFFLQLIFPFVPQKKFYFIYLFIFAAKVKHGILASKDFKNQLILIRPWLKKKTLRVRYLPIYIYTHVGRVFNLLITVESGVKNILRTAPNCRFGGFRKEKKKHQYQRTAGS